MTLQTLEHVTYALDLEPEQAHALFSLLQADHLIPFVVAGPHLLAYSGEARRTYDVSDELFGDPTPFMLGLRLGAQKRESPAARPDIRGAASVAYEGLIAIGAHLNHHGWHLDLVGAGGGGGVKYAVPVRDEGGEVIGHIQVLREHELAVLDPPQLTDWSTVALDEADMEGLLAGRLGRIKLYTDHDPPPS